MVEFEEVLYFVLFRLCNSWVMIIFNIGDHLDANFFVFIFLLFKVHVFHLLVNRVLSFVDSWPMGIDDLEGVKSTVVILI